MSLIEPFIQKHKFVLTIVGLLILLFIIGGVFSFCSRSIDKKEEKLESNIDQQKGVNAVLVNQIANQQEVANGAANETNQALGNLGNSINRPSNQFDGNRANERFCRNFPTDPTCVRR
jgi:hypothetical protein